MSARRGPSEAWPPGGRVGGVAVTAAVAHVPGLSGAELPGAGATPACGPDDARTVLGRKGLLGKEPSTRLALCAVHRAFGLPPGRPAEPVPGAAGTAVLVSSNLGNIGTVCAVMEEMRAGRGVSPLDAPNASSNVIASTISIWYGLTGPNVMLCDGATSGLDAVRLGELLLRSGRAHRAVVVGVEPEDPASAELASLGPVGRPLLAGAACVVLEPYVPGETPAVLLGAGTGLAAREPEPDVPEGAVRLRSVGAGADALARLGDSYGAHGVLQVAVAAAELARRAGTPAGRAAGWDSAVLSCGDPEDGYAARWLGLVAAAAEVPVPAGAR